MSGTSPTDTAVRLGVLADDLTGAHATAAQLVAQGRRALVVWHPNRVPAGGEDVVVDMRSRDRSERPGQVAEAWARTVADAGCTRIELRVDTALRGAGAEELAGVLRGLDWEDSLVVAVPAYPQAGRSTVHAVQHIVDASGGRRITDAGQRLFGDAYWCSVPLEVVHEGHGAVTQHVMQAFHRGVRRILLDAASDEHLRVCAASVESLHHALPRLVTMSSGAWLRYYPAAAPGGFVVVVVASPTPANVEQLQRLRVDPGAVVLPAGCADIDIGAALINAPTVVVVDTTSGPPEAGQPVSTAAGTAAKTAAAVATAGARQGLRCLGFIVTGGAAAAHLVDVLGAESLRPVREVRPLCAQGHLVGGAWSSLPVISKGGVIGEPDTLSLLVAAISTACRQRADTPPSAEENHV